MSVELLLNVFDILRRTYNVSRTCQRACLNYFQHKNCMKFALVLAVQQYSGKLQHVIAALFAVHHLHVKPLARPAFAK
jgi:hypothetical protein